MAKFNPSVRAQVITRRTYNRPLNNEGTKFESWQDTVDRVERHQRWLWERAKGKALTRKERIELAQFRRLMEDRKVAPSGRTLWLGGTDIAKTREASQFNCSFVRVETVHDVVDAFWLLLQGCGVGFEPVVGTLSGFTRPVELEIVRSTKNTDSPKGDPNNHEYVRDGVWTIKVGDSAEAWAKSIGKLLRNKGWYSKLVLDFSEVRAAGLRLKGYGWISSGDETIAKAFKAIVELLNKRAALLLTRMDILDLMNWLGTTLSSRRSAEIALVPYGDPEWVEFAKAKNEWWIGNPQRAQSNNSLVFYHKPSVAELTDIFEKLVIPSGGSEPGFINGAAALKRAPWFKGVNPCAEIMLGNRSFCNLVELDLGKFNGDFKGLIEAIRLIARANYRQTCVNLDDGVLQRTWHELNEFLRLCGVGLTGIVRWEYVKDGAKFAELRKAAVSGAHSMADELGLPRPKAVTTVKPSGTLGKIMDTTEGVHKPLGRYIFNNVAFSKHDHNVALLSEAGYRVIEHPTDSSSMLVTLPVSFPEVEFEEANGTPVNLETAVEQLDRYKLLMDNYVDHNCSITVSYDPTEVPAIVEWLHANWDTYVGVSFLYRNDPTKTAKDLGYLYLPQEVVTKEVFDAYAKGLRKVDLDTISSLEALDDDCATGACPIR